MFLRRTEAGVRVEVMDNYGATVWPVLPAVRHWSGTTRGFIALFIVTIFLAWLPAGAVAQETSITASVDKSDVSTDELVVLTIQVIDASPRQPRPLLPHIDGLAVIDLDLTTSVTNENGTLYTEVLFTYRLQPRRTGRLTIPPIPIEFNDKVLETKPISLNVTQGKAPLPSSGNEVNPDDITPPPDLKEQDFFIESLVDIQQPYVHQQIIHTFRFYQAIQLYKEPNYDEPLFTGFETAGLPVRQYNLEIGGRTYLINEIRTMLFPKKVGTVTIRPARLVLLGNFYEDPVEMYSEAVTVEVRALPDDAPAGFNGAVGQYDLKAWFRPTVAVVNQPSTFYVAISGAGNMNLLPEPSWPQTDWWRAYDTLTSVTTDITEDKLMTGTRVFERLVVPGQTGEQTIPPAQFVYFDPLAGEYRTISSEPLTVEVIPAPTPDPTDPTPTVTVTPAPTHTPVPIADAGQPAAFEPEPAVEVNPPGVDSQNLLAGLVQLPLATLMFLSMCGLLPLAAAAGAGGLWLWQRRQGQNQFPVRPSPPPAEPADKPQPTTTTSTIHPALAAAMKESDDNYKTVQMALNSYLSETLQRPVNGLTQAELGRYLEQHGLDESLIQAIQSCLTRCEMERYGPATNDSGWSLMTTADELLVKLDGALKKRDVPPKSAKKEIAD